MEKYIGFAILLFLLSMICERLADSLKHYIGRHKIPWWPGLLNMFLLQETTKLYVVKTGWLFQNDI